VLVVEDEPDGRELMVETLRAAGAQVAGASSAAEALELLPVILPDVLVSDIGMPEEDGYTLLARVRALPPEKGGAVPALAVSAYAREDDRIRAAAAGFKNHLAKPFEPPELVALVGSLREACAIAMAGPRAVASPRRVLVVEDDDDSREGLRLLLETWGHEVEVASNGQQAIEKAITGRPGVALIDIGLPELDGYSVAQRIREAIGGAEMVLVALTGYGEAEQRQRALQSGFDAHLVKPVNYSALSSLLERRF
jgi:CheY-like chemotaxis protein